MGKEIVISDSRFFRCPVCGGTQIEEDGWCYECARAFVLLNPGFVEYALARAMYVRERPEALRAELRQWVCGHTDEHGCECLEPAGHAGLHKMQ